MRAGGAEFMTCNVSYNYEQCSNEAIDWPIVVLYKTSNLLLLYGVSLNV